jgi:uncharacterized protein YdaL
MRRRAGRAVPLAVFLALVMSLLAPIRPASAATTTSALVLYDTTGDYGWMGQAYATLLTNLASHFGTVTGEAIQDYSPTEVEAYTATYYIGSTYDEPIPAAFLQDVQTTTKPVTWLFDNIWELGGWTDAFAAKYGFNITSFDSTPISAVSYKGQDLQRHPDAGPILGTVIKDASKAKVIATAKHADGTTAPWAIRSGNLTYIADQPLSYMSENDRYLILSDLLFDALAPATVERHRAMVRLEDVGPNEDAADFRAAVDYLLSEKVPFSFGVYPLYKDPNGVYNGGVPQTTRLKDNPDLVREIKYAISKGGVMIMHGYTHQYSNVANPYGGTSGDDFEFYLAHVDATTNDVVYDGPVPEDSTKWASDRINKSTQEFKAAGLAKPGIFEFPHYAGSAADYKAVAGQFTTRYERSLYPVGLLSKDTPDYGHVVGQFFPYVVKDAYGTKVLPENLGNYEPEAFNNHPPRFPADMVASAKRNLVIRDGFASFFYHPYYGTDALKQTVQGIKALGYTFVSPTTL